MIVGSEVENLKIYDLLLHFESEQTEKTFKSYNDLSYFILQVVNKIFFPVCL